METVVIKGQLRTDLGKQSTKTARRAGNVPCVIYGGGVENIHFTAPSKAFKSVLYTPDFKMVEVEVDGASYKCLLKSTQFHPVTDELLHVDLIVLIEGRKVVTEVPIRFKGVSPGVKQGGKLLQKMRRAKIKVLPKDLISELYVDISGLDLGDSARVRELEVDTTVVEVMNPGATPVATVEIPRALRSASASAEEEGEEATAEA